MFTGPTGRTVRRRTRWWNSYGLAATATYPYTLSQVRQHWTETKTRAFFDIFILFYETGRREMGGHNHRSETNAALSTVHTHTYAHTHTRTHVHTHTTRILLFVNEESRGTRPQQCE